MFAARHDQTRHVCAAFASNCFTKTSGRCTLCRHGACLPRAAGGGSLPVLGVGAHPLRVPRERQCAACLRGTRFAALEAVGSSSEWALGAHPAPRTSHVFSAQCLQAVAPDHLRPGVLLRRVRADARWHLVGLRDPARPALCPTWRTCTGRRKSGRALTEPSCCLHGFGPGVAP